MLHAITYPVISYCAHNYCIQYDLIKLVHILERKCFSDQKGVFETLDYVVHMLHSFPLGLSSYPQIEPLCVKVYNHIKWILIKRLKDVGMVVPKIKIVITHDHT